MTTLYGAAVTLRPVRQDDTERLTAILMTPEVARWWPHYDAQRVQAELVENSAAVVFAVEAADELIGCVQYSEESSPDYRHASIDIFLDPAWHGKGLGTDALRTLARHLVFDLGHHRLAIDPAAENERAIRAYERIGFRRVGVMRDYERDGDGQWHDGLLMDLLKKDLH